MDMWLKAPAVHTVSPRKRSFPVSPSSIIGNTEFVQEPAPVVPLAQGSPEVITLDDTVLAASPVCIDAEVWAALPDDVRRDVMRDYGLQPEQTEQPMLTYEPSLHGHTGLTSIGEYLRTLVTSRPPNGKCVGDHKRTHYQT
jgi:hypothetical protein